MFFSTNKMAIRAVIIHEWVIWKEETNWQLNQAPQNNIYIQKILWMTRITWKKKALTCLVSSPDFSLKFPSSRNLYPRKILVLLLLVIRDYRESLYPLGIFKPWNYFPGMEPSSEAENELAALRCIISKWLADYFMWCLHSLGTRKQNI